MDKTKVVSVGIHQPNFFPWLGFFHKMKESDVFIILDTVDIVLGSSKAITHRTKIKTIQGESWLSLPLKKEGTKIIKELQFREETDWRNELLSKIKKNYHHSPFFNEVFPFIEECVQINISNLSVYNTRIIKMVAERLKIKTTIFFASELNVTTIDKNERLIELIKKIPGNVYLSGKGGQSYNDEAMFDKNEIVIKYLTYTPKEYSQLHGGFISGLSVIDYLFSVNPKEYGI